MIDTSKVKGDLPYLNEYDKNIDYWGANGISKRYYYQSFVWYRE